MSTLDELMILFGADNRPPMLEKRLVAKDLRERVQLLMQGGNNSGQQRVVKCFNCQGEGHMARQCLKPQRKKDAIWFRDKVLLLIALGSAKAVLMANLSSYGSDVLSEGNEMRR
nr:hypothetical protein [Tanacetum cinerariifolium]